MWLSFFAKPHLPQKDRVYIYIYMGIHFYNCIPNFMKRMTKLEKNQINYIEKKQKNEPIIPSMLMGNCIDY